LMKISEKYERCNEGKKTNGKKKEVI